MTTVDEQNGQDQFSRRETLVNSSGLSNLDDPTDDEPNRSGEDGRGGEPAKDVDGASIGPFSHDRGVIRHAHDEQHEGRGGESLDDAGNHERTHGVDAEKIHGCRSGSQHCDDGVEPLGLANGFAEAVLPAEVLAEVLGGAAGHDGERPGSRRRLCRGRRADRLRRRLRQRC